MNRCSKREPLFNYTYTRFLSFERHYTILAELSVLGWA